jgi:hypothetical protein
MAKLLVELQQPTELCDGAGKLLGVFTPQGIGEKSRPATENCPWTLEEAERLWEDQRHLPGRPLAEFWREIKEAKGKSG